MWLIPNGMLLCYFRERERERGMSGKKRPAMSRRTQENWRGGNDDIEKMYEELVNLLVVFSHTAKNHRKKNGEDASKYVRKVDSSLNWIIGKQKRQILPSSNQRHTVDFVRNIYFCSIIFFVSKDENVLVFGKPFFLLVESVPWTFILLLKVEEKEISFFFFKRNLLRLVE